MQTFMAELQQLEQKLAALRQDTTAAIAVVEEKARQIPIRCPFCGQEAPLHAWTFRYYVTSEKWNFDELLPDMQLSYSRIQCPNPKCEESIFLEDWNAKVESECGRKSASLGPLRAFIISYRKLMHVTQHGY